MSDSIPDPSKARVIGTPLIAVAMTAVALVTAVTMALRNEGPSGNPPGTPGGLSVSLAIAPFAIGDSVASEWDASHLADSLADYLSKVPGIHATANSTKGEYVLRGDVSMKNGRLILTTRLGREDNRDDLWTATFWRSAESGRTVIPDLASAVAEAVLVQSARENLTTRRGKQ